jgi:hypothetical protein
MKTQESIMKQSLNVIFFLAATMPAVAAETTQHYQSPADANPACMEVNGPECIIQSPVTPSRVAAPRVIIVPPDTTNSTGTSTTPVTGASNTAPTGTNAPAAGTAITPAERGVTIISPR